MIQTMRNLIRRISSNPPPATLEQSGVRTIPLSLRDIQVADREVMSLTCCHESDMMLKLSIVCPFLRHRDYQVEVGDYLFTHFDQVFAFTPDSR